MQETPRSKRFNIVDREFYSIDLEYNEQYAILHLPRLDKLTKDIYLEMLFGIEDFADFIKASGYFGLWAAVDPNNKKLRKLIEKLGFKYLGTAESLAVFEWEKF